MITTTPHYTPGSKPDLPPTKGNSNFPVWKLLGLLLLGPLAVLLLSLAGMLGLLLFLACLPVLLFREWKQLPPRTKRF